MQGFPRRKPKGTSQMMRTIGITTAMGVMTTVALTAGVTPAEAAKRVPAPSGLHRVESTARTISLDWRNTRGASAYRVQVSKHRNMSNAHYYRFGRSKGTLRRLSPLTRYYYRVAALRSGRPISAYTPRGASAMTRQLPGPKGLTVVNKTTSSVTLSWKPVRRARGYRVSTSTSPSFKNPIRVRTTRLRADVGGLSSGTQHYFRVVGIRANGKQLTRPSRIIQAATTSAQVSAPPAPVVNGPSDVRAGSYNVVSVSLDGKDPNMGTWRQRRSAVLANILGEHLDVLGLQEANHGTSFQSRLVTGTTQFDDILRGLRAGGQNYAITNPYSANCVNATTTHNCVYKDRGVAGSDRIMYNADKLSMISQGGYAFPTQMAGGTPRNMAYAVFQVNRTGDRFFFASTHLESRDVNVRYAQWGQLISRVRQLKGSLPVIAVGDFNLQKMDPKAATWLPAMKNAGMGDVLNQEYRVNPGRGIRAQHMINGWINSANHLSRDVRTFSYADARHKTGNNIDYVFATNSLPVKEWKMVVNYDPATLKVRGVIPSDHNMVRATVTLP
jgi:endonuclease/exonuclease/phosphatase family metal-dependent hydrolase